MPEPLLALREERAADAQQLSRHVRCTCGQVVFRITPGGRVRHWGDGFAVERDGRLVITCPACGERVRWDMHKKPAA